MSTTNWLSARVRGARVLLVGGGAEPVEDLISGGEAEIRRTARLAGAGLEPGFDTIVMHELPRPADLAAELAEARRVLNGAGGALVLAAPVGAREDGSGAEVSLAVTLESLSESFAIERIEPLEGHLGVVATPRSGSDEDASSDSWAGALEALEHQLNVVEKRREIEHERAERQADQLRRNREKLARSRRKLKRAKEKAERIARRKARVERELEELKRTRAVRLARRLSSLAPGSSGSGEKDGRRRSTERADVADAESPGDEEPELTADLDADEADAEEVGVAEREAPAPTVDVALLFPPYEPAARSPVRANLRVACVMDDFSRLAFSPEFEYVDFGPGDWRAVLEAGPPDLLLVESAWRGKEGLWKGQIPRFERHYEPDPDLAAVVSWCRDRDIPTVFWGKEDPPNFHRFVDHAVLFDFIFTTDEETIPRYVERAGHDRVELLPFAMQPRIHNPAGGPRPRPFDVAFAGSYWHGRYPERMAQMETVLAPALEFGLQIFSRPASDEDTGFPEPYASHVVGSLPYESVLTAYRSYKAFLNVNSVPSSRSMCARRIFELLACGASVISGPSPAIERLLGPGLVRESSSRAQTRESLELILGDEELRDREATSALRALMAEHTYGHRVSRILATAGVGDERLEPTVSAVAVARSDAEREAVERTIARQSRARVEAVVVESDGGAVSERLGEGIKRATGDYVAILDAGSRYGDNYVADLVKAFAYADTRAAGKASRYEAAGDRLIRVAGPEHEPAGTLDPRAVVLERSFAQRLSLRGDDFSAVGESLAEEARRLGSALHAADRFNFVGGGDPAHSYEEAEV